MAYEIHIFKLTKLENRFDQSVFVWVTYSGYPKLYMYGRVGDEKVTSCVAHYIVRAT